MVSRSRFETRISDTMDVLYGGNVPKKIPTFMKRIAESLEKPDSMYLYIEEIINSPGIEDHRIHLARIQIDSELHMRDDVDRHTQRLWAAQTIEKMVFGGLMVDGEKLGDEEEDQDSQ
jgi:hypothetical protein